jgi:hypothetical protein
MVMQVARADIDLVGDLIRRRLRFTLFVEQQQAGNEDAIFRVALHGDNDGAISGRIQRERSFLAIGNTP